MSYFEKIGNTITSKGREITQKARAFSETSSLNNIIKAEQHKIDTNYKMMGKLYFEKYGDCASEEFAESVSAVRASMKKISETQEQITKIRKRNCCTECGTPFKSDSVFCSKCGARIREEQPKPKEIRCANCGNKLDDGALFCDSCGTKVCGDVPLPDTYEKSSEPEIIEVNGTAAVAETVQEFQTETVPEENYVVEAVQQDKNQGGEAKKCPSCGAEADDEQALFCNNCGEKLS